MARVAGHFMVLHDFMLHHKSHANGSGKRSLVYEGYVLFSPARIQHQTG